MIARFLAFLWNLARFAPSQAFGLRFGSAASILVTFLTIIFFLVGVGLVVVGVDLDAADRWLDAQGGWLAAAGTILFKGVLAAVLLVCLIVATSPLTDRRNPDGPGGCMVVAAIAVGYFCAVGLFWT